MPKSCTLDELLDAYKKKVCDRADLIDSANERDWESIFLGLAIGMGYPIEKEIEKDGLYSFYTKHALPLEG